MRASSACTRSSSGGCVANHEALNLAMQLGRAAGEEHVRDIDGVFVLEPRAGRIRRHHDEGTLQRLRVARELHGRCIGQMLAAPRDSRLQQATDQRARAAGNEDAERNQLHTGGAFAAAALVHEAPREIADHAEAEDPCRQAHVDLHVAVEDVTEFVADHGLQLVAIEGVERALRNRHRRLVG